MNDATIGSQRADGTYQPDGRCDHREGAGNGPGTQLERAAGRENGGNASPAGRAAAARLAATVAGTGTIQGGAHGIAAADAAPLPNILGR